MAGVDYSKHFGQRTQVAGTLLYEGWNQLDLFSEERNKEVFINVQYIKWKFKTRITNEKKVR